MAPFVRRAPRISQADVFGAADELLLEGHRPTIDRVRMRLGRGSPDTINDHLDAWWAKLGSRLRDVHGHEFPQLPERVAQALQHLWNEALEGARGALQSTLLAREQALAHREQSLDERTRQLIEREQAMAARMSALEESLTLAREQLTVANQRAPVLEATVQERDRECHRLRSRIDSLESECANGRTKFDTAAAAHHDERVRMQERNAAAETHWLLEVDRARQQAKEAAKEHEQQLREVRRRMEALQSERDQLRHDLLEVRAECKAAAVVRAQLKERRRARSQAASVPASTAKPKAGAPMKRWRRRANPGPAK